MQLLTDHESWKILLKHAQSMRFSTIRELHHADPDRAQSYMATAASLILDYSNQRLNDTSLELLIDLANERKLRDKIVGLMRGDVVNASENKPALHTALRTFNHQPILVQGKNIIPDIQATLQQMRIISESLRTGKWLGFSNKPITDVINIGTGGSDLGPKFGINALSKFITPEINFHFISDGDPDAFLSTIAKLKPDTTLFIVASKSFTTKETLYNLEKAKDWLGERYIANQIVAVTANAEKAFAYGIRHILPIWDWVGGRYSACSAINLITVIGIGFEQFQQLLHGAYQMDLHFQSADFKHNLPVLLALIGIWNINLLDIQNLLILNYSKSLEYFVPYIQQLDMESNGKSIDNQGREIHYCTSPLIWGGLGNQVQHSYYQLLCQGMHKITLDFITLQAHENELIHEIYSAKKRVLTEGVVSRQNPIYSIRGNIPLNHIQLPNCTPETIGALIALYEHKIFTQSVIWDINPFDQPGVELSKQHEFHDFGFEVSI